MSWKIMANPMFNNAFAIDDIQFPSA